MKVVVDRDLCEANAVCVGLLPDVFEIDEDERLVILQPSPPEGLREDLELCVARCPRGALTLEG